jgi:mannose-6-phosphate isomerase-like protein (cupin superfamily)
MMPKVSKESAQFDDYGMVHNRHEDLEGYTVQFVSFLADADPTPLLKGLPNDHCHCPHWGIVTKGKVTFRYEDGREEVLEAGDAFYTPPGHVPIVEAGTEYLQFSPKEPLDEVSRQIMANMQALQSA